MLTNEITTHISIEEGTQLVPALGESHSHRVNHQITLGHDDDDRRLFVANIDKCFVKCEKKVPFLVS